MHWLVRSSSFSKAQGLRETGSRFVFYGAQLNLINVFSSMSIWKRMLLAYSFVNVDNYLPVQAPTDDWSLKKDAHQTNSAVLQADRIRALMELNDIKQR